MLLHELQMWATKRFNDDKEIESELGDLLDDRLHGEEEKCSYYEEYENNLGSSNYNSRHILVSDA